jgi:hypothetical protein
MSAGNPFPTKVTTKHVNVRALMPQSNTVYKWPNGTTADKPILGSYVWHCSNSTVFVEQDSWAETGYYDPGYRRKLQDSAGGYWNGTGYTQPYFEVHGYDGQVIYNSSLPYASDVGRRQGDYMIWTQLAPWAQAKWIWGVPPGGDFVPPGVAGVNYISPGYS